MEKAPMTLEEKVDHLTELVEKNNRLLKHMRRDALWGGIIKTIIWIVLIGLSFYFSMKFLEPYMGMLNQQGNQFNPEDFKAIIDLYQGNLGQ